MPDLRQHRGAHPEDARWFAPAAIPLLRGAVDDYSCLLSRSYASNSAIKLVGDHYQLAARQRIAVMRCSCSAQSFGVRQHSEAPLQGAADTGLPLQIDGYNALTTVEAAIAGGVVLLGRDGCMRDMASMHGSWRKVEETEQAICLIGQCLERADFRAAQWLLDAPVSNSARLKSYLLRLAAGHGWGWDVQLVPDPDRPLSISPNLVATADSAILDLCPHWLNLARHVVRQCVPGAWVIDLSATPSSLSS